MLSSFSTPHTFHSFLEWRPTGNLKSKPLGRLDLALSQDLENCIRVCGPHPFAALQHQHPPQANHISRRIPRYRRRLRRAHQQQQPASLPAARGAPRQRSSWHLTSVAFSKQEVGSAAVLRGNVLVYRFEVSAGETSLKLGCEDEEERKVSALDCPGKMGDSPSRSISSSRPCSRAWARSRQVGGGTARALACYCRFLQEPRMIGRSYMLTGRMPATGVGDGPVHGVRHIELR